MKERVAEVAGLERDSRALDKVGHHIYRVIDRLNVWDRFAFLREQTNDTALTQSDTSATMHEDVYIPLALLLVDLDGKVKYTLERIDYETLMKRGLVERDDGANETRPMTYAILNPYSDRTYYWWPAVSESTATELKLRQVYYKRLGRPSGDDDFIQAPEEVVALVELGAQFRFARLMRPNHTALWSSLGRDFKAMLMEMTQADERDNHEAYNWTYGPQNSERHGAGPTFLEAFWRY